MKEGIQKILSNLEKTRNKFWNISKKTGQFLNFLIRDRSYKTVLEIGTSNGYSGIWIAEALSKTNGKLYTMESNKKERFPLATQNFLASGLTKYITQILGHAPKDIPKTPPKFDLVFFDATKYEHLDYFNALKNRLKKNGMIVTDNVYSHKKELAEYLKTVKKNKNFFSIELSVGTGLLLSLKIK